MKTANVDIATIRCAKHVQEVTRWLRANATQAEALHRFFVEHRLCRLEVQPIHRLRAVGAA